MHIKIELHCQITLLIHRSLGGNIWAEGKMDDAILDNMRPAKMFASQFYFFLKNLYHWRWTAF